MSLCCKCYVFLQLEAQCGFYYDVLLFLNALSIVKANKHSRIVAYGCSAAQLAVQSHGAGARGHRRGTGSTASAIAYTQLI